jgi:glycosyltransferase involved in cell wall biosynthesis
VRLAVIGDTQHYFDDEGRLCALEPVVNQLDRWAELFDDVIVCAPLDPGPPPLGFAPYRSRNLRIEPLRRAGGNSWLAKLGLIGHVVPWAWKTRQVARRVDAVHLRCPCNIGLVAIFSTWRAVRYRYALYAGVWHGYEGEPRFFALQRRLLGSRWFDGPVSVYASRQLDRPHLEPFFSPSFGDVEWAAAGPGAEAKVERLRDPTHSGPWRLVTVGRLTRNKNQQAIIRSIPSILGAGIDVRLDVYGDGPERPGLEQLAEELGVREHVVFNGSVDHGVIMQAFAQADLNLLTTRQEGYGKVLLEGMVHATVPVFARSPVADEIAGGGSRGIVVPADAPEVLAAEVVALVGDRERWAVMAQAARDFSASVTLDVFQDRVRDMLERQWQVELSRAGDVA